MSNKAPEESAPLEDIAGALVANHRAFLSFVERRVGNRATAEEILQEAFVRSIDKLGDVRESAIGWFYRVLRNAITDHYRRAAAAERRNEAYAREVPDDDDELQQAACKCVLDLAKTLKPEYANALERVEVAGLSVKEYADEVGISSNNAGVRIFRAREALRKQVARSCGTCATHGCVDCSCSE